eukprot:Gb_22767 [translate_table: standard]
MSLASVVGMVAKCLEALKIMEELSQQSGTLASLTLEMEQVQVKLDLLTKKKVGTEMILYQAPPIPPLSSNMLAPSISRSEIVPPNTHASQRETNEVGPYPDILVASPSLLEVAPELPIEEVIRNSPLSRIDTDELEKDSIPPKMETLPWPHSSSELIAPRGKTLLL